MRLKKTFIIFLLTIILLNLYLVYAINTNTENNEYFRIHVVANSDSIDDQLLKYTVAKHVNEYISNVTSNCETKNECKQAIKDNMQNILNLSNDIVSQNNCKYNIKAYIGKQLYDEKQMNNLHMNAGIYDSLKIVIGNGNGQNWWSLIYPTTFMDNTTEDFFDEDTKYSFGIIELIQNLFI